MTGPFKQDVLIDLIFGITYLQLLQERDQRFRSIYPHQTMEIRGFERKFEIFL